MNRRHFTRTTATALLAGSPLFRLLAHGYRPAAKLTMLRDRVGVYTDRGGTIAFRLPTDNGGGVIVDTQFPDQAANLRDELAQRGGTDLDLLFNTHHHGDHTAGNATFAGLARHHVSHERARRNLEQQQADQDADRRAPLPGTTFTEDYRLGLGDGGTVTARHFGPAHTGGDAVLHFTEENIVHLGDLLFNRRFPYVDPAAGADIVNWIGVIRKVRKTYGREAIYVFGHAAESYPVTGNHMDLAAFEDYLKELRRYVKRAKKLGTSLESLLERTTVIPGASEWRTGERQLRSNLELMYAAV